MIAVFWHAIVFGLAPLLQRLAGMVLLPFYTHFLTPADYGEIEILTIATGLFGVVLRLELRPGFMRAWIAAPDEAARAALLATAFRLVAALGAAGTALFLLSAGMVSGWLLGHEIGWPFRITLAVGLFAETLAMIGSAALQAMLRSGTMVTLGLFQFAVSAGLTILCVAFLHLGALGFFIGGSAASLLGLFVMIWLLRGQLRGGARARAETREMVRYSLPLLAGALLYFVVRNADRLAVSQLMSVGSLGIYAMAWTLANVLLTTVFAPLQSSYDVWRYKFHQDGGRAADAAEFFRAAMVVIAAAAIALNTFGADAFVFFSDPRFAQAVAYLPLLSGAVLLQAGYTFLAAAFFVSGKTARWLGVFAGGAAAQVTMSLLLIPPLGLYGAACGILAANTLLYAGAARWGARLWAVRYPHARVAAVILLSVLCAEVRVLGPPLLGEPLALGAALTWDAAVCAGFAAALLLTGIVARADLEAGWRLATVRLARKFGPATGRAG